MSKKVIYIVKTDLHYYPPCMAQIRMLKKSGVNIEVWFASSNQSAIDILEKEDIDYICLGESYKPVSKLDKIKNWIEFRRKISKQLSKIDKVILNDIFFWIGTAESAIPLIGKIKKYNYILTMLELLDDPANRYKLKLFGLMARKAKSIVVCEQTRAYLIKYWFKLKALPYIMPNKPYGLKAMRRIVPTCDNTREAIDRIKDKKFIIYQGIFQNVNYMVEFAKAMKEINSDYYLVIMGFDLYNTGMYHKIKTIYDKVIHLESLSAPLHLEVTSYADIGLVFYEDNSLNHAFCAPNKIYEYSAFGIPSLGNNIPGLENTIGKAKAGICVEFKKELLIEALNDLINNYLLYKKNSHKFYESTDNQITIDMIIRDNHINT